MASKQLTGLCGEHYVAAMLAGSELVVAVPRGGSAREDLFVADSKRGRPIRLQVKTARDPFGDYKYKGQHYCSWPTDCGIIDSHDEGLWFAFVALKGWPAAPNLPEVLFVPSSVVAERMESEKGKSRTFFWLYLSDAEQYKNASGIELLKAAIVPAGQ